MKQDKGNQVHKESARMGQTIVTSGPPDKSSYMPNDRESLMGRDMKGGPQDVSHSVTNAGKVPRS